MLPGLVLNFQSFIQHLGCVAGEVLCVGNTTGDKINIVPTTWISELRGETGSNSHMRKGE